MIHFRDVPSSLTPQIWGLYASLQSFQTSHEQSSVLKALSDIKVDYRLLLPQRSPFSSRSDITCG